MVVGVDCFRFELGVRCKIWKIKYLFSIRQVIIRQDELVGAENIPSRHDNKQQHSPNDPNLAITTQTKHDIVDSDGKSKTTRSSNPLHDIHSQLLIKRLH